MPRGSFMIFALNALAAVDARRADLRVRARIFAARPAAAAGAPAATPAAAAATPRRPTATEHQTPTPPEELNSAGHRFFRQTYRRGLASVIRTRRQPVGPARTAISSARKVSGAFGGRTEIWRRHASTPRMPAILRVFLAGDRPVGFELGRRWARGTHGTLVYQSAGGRHAISTSAFGRHIDGSGLHHRRLRG